MQHFLSVAHLEGILPSRKAQSALKYPVKFAAHFRAFLQYFQYRQNSPYKNPPAFFCSKIETDSRPIWQ